MEEAMSYPGRFSIDWKMIIIAAIVLGALAWIIERL